MDELKGLEQHCYRHNDPEQNRVLYLMQNNTEAHIYMALPIKLEQADLGDDLQYAGIGTVILPGDLEFARCLVVLLVDDVVKKQEVFTGEKLFVQRDVNEAMFQIAQQYRYWATAHEATVKREIEDNRALVWSPMEGPTIRILQFPY